MMNPADDETMTSYISGNDDEYFDVQDDAMSEESYYSSHKKKHSMEEKPKGQHRIWRHVKGRRVPIEIFTTKLTPGSRIRNAVTGLYETNAYVGRIDEYAFFKVVLATGELGPDAYSTVLFYDSPEQYERHLAAILPPEQKQKWTNTKTEYLGSP